MTSSDQIINTEMAQSSATDVLIGPVIPAELLNKEVAPIGPLPPPDHEKLPTSPSASSFGPQLPPHLLVKQDHKMEKLASKVLDEKIIGPSLPPHLRERLQSDQHSEDSEGEQEEYGPMPAGVSTYTSAQIALEERALQLRIKQLEPEKQEAGRESWMIELPEAKAATFGLGPRQFRSKAGPDLSDRSSWTDIPGKKDKQTSEKKIDLKAEAELKEIKKRDKQFDLMSKQHKRKSKSLVDIHQDKIRKKEKSTEVAERKPFNRETDLQVNKFDEAQKKAVLKKAQLLDDRFSSGKSKYL